MQISHINSFNFNNNFSLQDINQNLKLDEKQALRKALMQVPSKDLPKVLEKIKKIPVDENYINNILKTLQQEKEYKKEGFEIYA
ncbi:conserved hypothetical protein [Nautilia profundicola AmH]|uniref:Uncharacterized protein n=1 Tax=Nautilia profundicola (strain ATCC BAA-1463 / DSM 18972 / AmH) TaxID=598659 RepID=B9L678_NAUPA|nr:hypothetical protein [Nautilia profundicola]ACM92158.1 conserved hypothetical protein [Nautilia profundicola AmH]